MSKDFFDKLREERVNSHNKIKKIKHEIYISRNKVTLRGIWAWFFIAQAIILFVITVVDIIKLFI